MRLSNRCFPQGANSPMGAGYQHFDIYGSCDGGNQNWMRLIVNIYYTSPDGSKVA
jgi:hypothetical protein